MLARRVFADGRTRAYAWGRSAAGRIWPPQASACWRCRDSSNNAGWRGRPTSWTRWTPSSATSSAICAPKHAWPGASRPPRAAPMTRSRARASTEARLAELHALVEDTEGLEVGAEDRLREERERLRHVTELAKRPKRRRGAGADEGEGAAGLAALAERALGPEQIARSWRAHAASYATWRFGYARRLWSCARSNRSRPSRTGLSKSRLTSIGSRRPSGGSGAPPTRSLARAEDARSGLRSTPAPTRCRRPPTPWLRRRSGPQR